MHFFYLDESGDTGRDLRNSDQPIMVLGGISLRDEGWNQTRLAFEALLDDFFDGQVPQDFELHSYDLLGPEGAGSFAERSLEDRANFAEAVLSLLEDRKHNTHFISVDKVLMDEIPCGVALAFNPSRPYLLTFDYMITYINWYVKERLGRSARAMIILDEKRQHHADIEHIIRNRRREGPRVHLVKWIVEISYPVDSRRNPMVQISDLVVFCVRRFLEIEHGYHDDWPEDAKNFYARCYDRIAARAPRTTTVARGGRHVRRLNEYLDEVRCDPVGQWRRRYDLAR